MGTSQVSLPLNLLGKTPWEFAILPFRLRETALLAALIIPGSNPFRPGFAGPPSRLPARVLRPSGARPGPTGAEAETGAERCPLGTCAPNGGGRPPPRGGCQRFALTGGVKTTKP